MVCKTTIRVLFVSLSGFILFASSPSEAAKKQWDIERYSECLKHAGNHKLDIIETIESDTCRKGRSPISASDYSVGDFDIASSIAASRKKTDASGWVMFAKFRISTTDSRFYGDASALNQPRKGQINFSNSTTSMGDHVIELGITSQKHASPDCNVYRRGRLSMSECEMVSGVAIQLPSDLVDAIKAEGAANPLGEQMFKLFTDEMKGITLTIPYAEIIAVSNAVENIAPED